MQTRWKIILGLLVGLLLATSTVTLLLAVHTSHLQAENDTLRQQLETGSAGQKQKTPEEEVYFAVIHGQRGALKKLLEANPDLVNTTSGNNRATPLQVAAFNGRAWMVEELIRRNADINTTNVFGQTALHNAITSGNSDTVKALLKNKPDLTIRNLAGKTPQQHALDKNQTQFAELLRQAGATE